MAGTIAADTLTHSTAGSLTTDYVVNGSAKAWIAFNGTGTIAIKDSNNFASISDDGTGDYKSNLTSALSNANGSATSGGGHPEALTNVGESIEVGMLSSSQLSHESGTTSANVDFAHVNAAVHGDLA
ncbi:hypothetical protein N9E91_04320 [Alphaproteobacteria bacterium]|nr:hypothetical protein [Alphaproteobacteria bacterium]